MWAARDRAGAVGSDRVLTAIAGRLRGVRNGMLVATGLRRDRGASTVAGGVEMRLRKGYAVAVIAVILGMQAWASSPSGPGGWYWPFTSYPMYSGAHYADETVRELQLRLRACGPPGAADRSTVVGWEDVPLRRQQFRATLARATGAGSQDPDTAVETEAQRFVGRLVRERWPGSYCRAEVWTKDYRNGSSAADLRRVEWRLRQSWTLPPDSAGPSPADGHP